MSDVDLAFFAKESAARRTLQELDTALETDIVVHIEGYQLVIEALTQAVATESDPGMSLLDYDFVTERVSALVERLQQDNEKLLGGALASACHPAFLYHMHQFDAAQQNACTPGACGDRTLFQELVAI